MSFGCTTARRRMMSKVRVEWLPWHHGVVLLTSGAGGKCEHRVGCFFHLEMWTWSDAVLALSVVQAAANDVFHRWQLMPTWQQYAACEQLQGLPALRQASAPHTPTPASVSTKSGASDTGSRYRGSGRKEQERDDSHAILDSDTAALKTAGVAEATPLYPPPIVIYEEGTTPPEVVRGYTGVCAPGHKPSCVRPPFVVQRICRVYRGTWKHNGAARDVIVKVVSRRQAAREARVLEAVSVRKEARAIQLLAQVPINGDDGDVGLGTPFCTGGHLFEGAASFTDVVRQAVQLCEVRQQLARGAVLLFGGSRQYCHGVCGTRL